MKRNQTNQHSSRMIVVGAPIFGNDPFESFRAPVGQQDLHWRVWNETRDHRELGVRLGTEYYAVLLTLKQMGVRFEIAWAHEDKILPGLKEKLIEQGFRFVAMPDVDYEAIAFPRDLAFCLGNFALFNTDMKLTIRLPARIGSHQVISSPYGEGGRLLSRGRIGLVADRLYPSQTAYKSTGKPPETQDLEKTGIRVGFLPHHIMFEIDQRASVQGFIPDDHLDRTKALVEDRKGRLHLLVAPGNPSGFRHPWKDPAIGADEALELCRRTCGTLGIEVHVPKAISIPGVLNLHQFQDGRVIMTGGDDEVAAMVESLVGRKNVYQTPVPIALWPAQVHGGIRCLIGDLPIWIKRLSEYVKGGSGPPP